MGLFSSDESGASWSAEDSRRHDEMINVIREAYPHMISLYNAANGYARGDYEKWLERAEKIAIPQKMRLVWR